MEIIDEDTFNAVDKKKLLPHEELELAEREENKQQVDAARKMIDNPVDLQKDLAAAIKVSVEEMIQRESSTGMGLSQETRKWVATYSDILDNIRRGTVGEVTTNLHLHGMSHQQLSAKIRAAAARKAKTAGEIVDVKANG